MEQCKVLATTLTAETQLGVELVLESSAISIFLGNHATEIWASDIPVIPFLKGGSSGRSWAKGAKIKRCPEGAQVPSITKLIWECCCMGHSEFRGDFRNNTTALSVMSDAPATSTTKKP